MCKIATIVASVFPSIAILLNDFFWKVINTEISNFLIFIPMSFCFSKNINKTKVQTKIAHHINQHKSKFVTIH